LSISKKLYKFAEKDSMITTAPSQMNTVDALWILIQSQTKAVRKALVKRILAEENLSKNEEKNQKTLVKDSLSRAFTELHAGKVHHNARQLFEE
jgi:hypothetical protein